MGTALPRLGRQRHSLSANLTRPSGPEDRKVEFQPRLARCFLWQGVQSPWMDMALTRVR